MQLFSCVNGAKIIFVVVSMSYLWPYQLYDLLRCIYYLWKSFKAFLYKRNSKRKTYFQRITVESDKTIVEETGYDTVILFLIFTTCCSLCLKLLSCEQIFEFCSQIVTDYIDATILLVSKIKMLGIIPIIFILLTNEKTRQD